MHYNSVEYLTELYKRLDVYLPNLIDDAPDGAPPNVSTKIRKLQAALIKECDAKCNEQGTLDLFDYQLVGQVVVRDIRISHLLGMNDVVIPHLVDEYARLKEILGTLNKEYKRLNRFPEIREFIAPFKLKELNSLLYEDLTQLCEEYSIECDIKEMVKSI